MDVESSMFDVRCSQGPWGGGPLAFPSSIPLPTPPSWGEGIACRLGGGITMHLLQLRDGDCPYNASGIRFNRSHAFVAVSLRRGLRTGVSIACPTTDLNELFARSAAERGGLSSSATTAAAKHIPWSRPDADQTRQESRHLLIAWVRLPAWSF